MKKIISTLEGTIWMKRVGARPLALHAAAVYGFYQLFAVNFFFLKGSFMAAEIYILFAITVYMYTRYIVEFALSTREFELPELKLPKMAVFQVLPALGERAKRLKIQVVPTGVSARVRGALSRQYSGA